MKTYDYASGLWYHEPPSESWAKRVTLRRGLEVEHFGSLSEASQWLGHWRGYLGNWWRENGERDLPEGWTIEVEDEDA